MGMWKECLRLDEYGRGIMRRMSGKLLANSWIF